MDISPEEIRKVMPRRLSRRRLIEADNELGMDPERAAILRNIILDENIELQPSGRVSMNSPVVNWGPKAYLNSAGWLCRLLELEPGHTSSLTYKYISRASMLNLVPSDLAFTRAIGSISSLQDRLGFVSQATFKAWTRTDYILGGQMLAEDLGHRPGRLDIQSAYQQKLLPAEKQIRKLFGSLQNYQETIGYPSVKNWTPEDYLDWGVAFKRQNGPDVPILHSTLKYLSSMGRGPSDSSIYNNCDSIPVFEAESNLEYIKRRDANSIDRAERLLYARQLSLADARFGEIIGELGDEQVLKPAAHYQLVKKLKPAASDETIIELSNCADSDYVASWLIQNSEKLTILEVESAATDLDIFDDLWPMYRFQNVDLNLDNYRRTHIKGLSQVLNSLLAA